MDADVPPDTGLSMVLREITLTTACAIVLIGS